MARVRTLSAEDKSQWLQMRRTLWPDCSSAMHDREMAEVSSNPDKHGVLVYQHDGAGDRLGGFVEVSIRDRVDGSLSRCVGYLEAWYVEPDLRGRGIGRQLIEAAEHWALERGASEIGSDCELNNSSGLAAHQALGFKETFRLVHLLKRIPPIHQTEG